MSGHAAGIVCLLAAAVSALAPTCTMHTVVGKACTNEKYVHLLPRPSGVSTAGECCEACAALDACGAWTYHGSMDCLLANQSSIPGPVSGATCGSKVPFPTAPPTPPTAPPAPLPPLPPPLPGVQTPSLSLVRANIIVDSTGFLRDPASPIQDADGVWHTWAVWVPPAFGTEGWSGFIKHFHTRNPNTTWINDGFALNHSSNPLAFDHTGMCSPSASYDNRTGRFYLFYTGATPEGTTGYPPRRGGSPMDNLSAQGVAVAESPFGPWTRLGVVAPGGLAWGPSGTGGGFRPNIWNGLRVDSGRALIVNNTKLWTTKGIGNGTAIPNSNSKGGYQALQGVFFPANPASWAPPYHAYPDNPVTRAGPTGNTYSVGGAENCEFFRGPDRFFHAVCACHGAKYPQGYIPHYVVQVLPEGGAFPTVRWSFAGFIHTPWSGEPTPIYEGGPPGDRATVRFMVARGATGLGLYLLTWSG